MNLLISICSIAVILYVIAESYTIITGWIAKYELEQEKKKDIAMIYMRIRLKKYC